MGKDDFRVIAPSALADALFPLTRQKVLGLLFGNPDRSFYGQEIIGRVASGSGAVQRELKTLVECGLVTTKHIGNQRHFQANRASPIFEELASIVLKTTGLVAPLREALAPLRTQIIAAFVYGSIAKRTDTTRSDIDLMLLADDVSYADVYLALEDVGHHLGRPVNPTILSRHEFSKRVAAQEAFLTRVIDQSVVWIIGNKDDLPL